MNLNLGDTQLIIQEAKKRDLLRNQLAYVLATTYHETAHTMKPVREYGGETYLKSKSYYPYVGMGYVQLTWKNNYKKAGDYLGVDFVNNPKLLLSPKYAVEILLEGMSSGWFRKGKLSDYMTLGVSDYFNARDMINGDKNMKQKGGDKSIGTIIADYARQYDNDLTAIGYGTENPKPVVITPTPTSKPVVITPTPDAPKVGFWELITSIFKLLTKKD